MTSDLNERELAFQIPEARVCWPRGTVSANILRQEMYLAGIKNRKEAVGLEWNEHGK